MAADVTGRKMGKSVDMSHGDTLDSGLLRLRSRTPFAVFNPGVLLANLSEYRAALPPNTEICYAMKANSEAPVLRTLKEAGASFEVASKYELSLLKTLHVPAQQVIYGSSVKPPGHIVEFAKYGVDRFAFDSEDELLKLARYAPGSRVFVRTLVDDRADSVFHLSEKFGTPLEDGVRLLLKAGALGLVPYGMSFNVGSQARNEVAWARGIVELVQAMECLSDRGQRIRAMNIGGGFPYHYRDGQDLPSIRQIGEHISRAQESVPYPIDYIAEPGRGLIANTCTLVVTVIGMQRRANGDWVYVDAGVYNALLEALACQGRTKYRVQPLRRPRSPEQARFILTGPTSDNLDVIDDNVMLPVGIRSGDKLAIYDVGAYSF